MLGQGDEELELRWVGPEGREHRSAVVILVSNNEYRLGRALGSGTRPHVDRGVLGVTVVEAAGADGAGHRPGWREWSTTTFEVGSNGSVATGIDGEAMMVDSPLRFEIVPAALRVRIASSHPGASPSAGMPESAWGAVVALTRIAVGHSRTP